MDKRIRIGELEPDAYKAMREMEKYLAATGLNPRLKELIKIRASQINGCAHCINMHTRDARKMGETEQRIYALSAWWDTPYFTEEEQAVLKLTEEVTLIHQRVSDETYDRAAKVLDEHRLAQVIMAIVAINGWNRISIATQLEPTD
ncbi:MAG TPA: carboxymuconolactone decarboxylase family protein [Puia sp.]|jgi:AhpD family alkylhydroperoxidase|nr:carboxymuconolactone decarboxylase family protein [Puia sp.]